MITNVYASSSDELSDAWLLSMVRVLTVRVEELELRLRDEQGDHAFRAYEEAVARKIGHTGDDDNVIGLRGRRSP